MTNPKANLLLVDDEPAIRTSLSLILTQVGYSVRTAEDGISALAEIQRETPEILLSDLNMPGMTGFDLLIIVRRSFPAVQVLAMSGAFSGNEVPFGVVADAFFQKGSGVASLLKTIEGLSFMVQDSMQPRGTASPHSIPNNRKNSSAKMTIAVNCPYCDGTCPQVRDGSGATLLEGNCALCGRFVQHAIVASPEQILRPAFARDSCAKNSIHNRYAINN